MDKLFSGLTGPDSCEFIDYTTPKCLDELVVRPVTTLVRRLIAKSDGYQSIQGVQAKYRSMSILKKARQERVSKKKRRKRRDVVEIRSKITSKHNRMWQALAKPSAGAEGEEKKNKKTRQKQENRQKQEVLTHSLLLTHSFTHSLTHRWWIGRRGRRRKAKEVLVNLRITITPFSR
jgi:hypothetical protein